MGGQGKEGETVPIRHAIISHALVNSSNNRLLGVSVERKYNIRTRANRNTQGRMAGPQNPQTFTRALAGGQASPSCLALRNRAQ